MAQTENFLTFWKTNCVTFSHYFNGSKPQKKKKTQDNYYPMYQVEITREMEFLASIKLLGV